MAKTTKNTEKETKCIIGAEILSTFGDTFIEHLLKSSAVNQQAEKMCADREYTFSDVVANELLEVDKESGEQVDSRYIIRLYNRETKEAFYTTSKGLCSCILKLLEPFNADLMGYKVTIHVSSVELEQGRTFSASIVGAESLEKINSITIESSVNALNALNAIDLQAEVPSAEIEEHTEPEEQAEAEETEEKA